MDKLNYQVGDYKVIKLDINNNVDIQCQKCNNIKKIKWWDFIKQQNKHSESCGDIYYQDFINLQYGDLQIIKYLGKINKQPKFLVQCIICETQRQVFLTALKDSTSIFHSGCRGVQVKNLDDNTKEFKLFYTRFSTMKNRTNNIASKDYKNYGGRGINSDAYPDFKTFYENQYLNFLEACKKFDSPSLERIDVNGNYEPSNIIWIEFRDQMKNTRRIKPFRATSPNNEIFITENQSEFARQYTLQSSGINLCLNHKIKSYKNWKFEYLTEEEFHLYKKHNLKNMNSLESKERELV